MSHSFKTTAIVCEGCGQALFEQDYGDGLVMLLEVNAEEIHTALRCMTKQRDMAIAEMNYWKKQLREEQEREALEETENQHRHDLEMREYVEREGGDE